MLHLYVVPWTFGAGARQSSCMGACGGIGASGGASQRLHGCAAGGTRP